MSHVRGAQRGVALEAFLETEEGRTLSKQCSRIDKNLRSPSHSPEGFIYQWQTHNFFNFHLLSAKNRFCLFDTSAFSY